MFQLKRDKAAHVISQDTWKLISADHSTATAENLPTPLELSTFMRLSPRFKASFSTILRSLEHGSGRVWDFFLFHLAGMACIHWDANCANILANLGTALIPHLVFGFREWSIVPDKIAHASKAGTQI